MFFTEIQTESTRKIEIWERSFCFSGICELERKNYSIKEFTKCRGYGSFICCPTSWDVFFTLSSHSSVVCCDKPGRRLVCIYDQFVRMLYWRAFCVISWRNCDLASTHKDLVMIGRNVVTARSENFILRCNDQTHDRLTWKSIYSSVSNKWMGGFGVRIVVCAQKVCQVLLSKWVLIKGWPGPTKIYWY